MKRAIIWMRVLGHPTRYFLHRVVYNPKEKVSGIVSPSDAEYLRIIGAIEKDDKFYEKLHECLDMLAEHGVI